MKRTPEIKRLDIVLLGDFNPKIFTPFWFASEGLLGQKEAESAVPEIIHSDVSIFKLDWCRLQVDRQRFSIFTEQEAYFLKIYDLVGGAFKLLEHTPVSAFGFNWAAHFKCESIEEYHSIGHYFVPQAPWQDVFKDSGMTRIEVSEKDRPEDTFEGLTSIRIQPSRVIFPGVFINQNDHYEVEDKTKIIGCSTIINKFIEKYPISCERAEKNINVLFNKFMK
jgi:hypothetical protein